MNGLTDSLYNFTPQFVSIVFTTIIVCWICIAYNKKIRMLKPGQPIGGWLVMINWFVRVVEDQIISTVGRKKLFWTPYIMYIYLYVFIASALAILGIESLATSFTVTLSMAFFTFIMIYFYGLKYQKLAFFKKYLNPTELISQFVPLISLSFRLFGNMVAGAVMLGLIYSATIGLEASFATKQGIQDTINMIWYNREGSAENVYPYTNQYKYFWSGFDIGSITVFPFLHMYFDLFDGFLQSLVFANLTLSYWGEQMHIEKKEIKHKDIEKANRKLEKQNKKAEAQLAA